MTATRKYKWVIVLKEEGAEERKEDDVWSAGVIEAVKDGAQEGDENS